MLVLFSRACCTVGLLLQLLCLCICFLLIQKQHVTQALRDEHFASSPAARRDLLSSASASLSQSQSQPLLQLSRDGQSVRGKAGSASYSTDHPLNLHMTRQQQQRSPASPIGIPSHHFKHLPGWASPHTEPHYSKPQTVIPHEGEHFVLFSTMDKEYFKLYSYYHEPTRRYAQRHNYSFLYHPDDFSYSKFTLRQAEVQPHYFRIFAALQLLRGEVKAYDGPPADWIVYIDSDAFIAEENLPLEAIVSIAKEFVATHPLKTERNQNCEFISQDHGHVVNSGFFLLKNSSWSTALLERWIAECEKGGKYNMHWVWDQGPLQNALLNEIALSRNVSYRDQCWRSRTDDAANRCWEKKMNELGLQAGMKKAGKICLLPKQRGIPYLHHSHGDCRSGVLVCHTKYLSPTAIENRVNQSVITSFDNKRLVVHIKANHIIVFKKWVDLPSIPSLYWSSSTFRNESEISDEFSFRFKHYFLSFFWINHHNEKVAIDFNSSLSLIDVGDYRNQEIIAMRVEQILGFMKLNKSELVHVSEQHIEHLPDGGIMIIPA